MIISSKFRLAWFICTLLLAGFLINSVSNFMVSRHNVRETITQSSLPLTSDNIYSEIQRDLIQPIFISSLMANDTFLKDWVVDGEKNDEQITKYLNEIKIKYSTVSSFFVSEKSHRYYHAHGLLKEIDENDPRDEWYFRVRNMKESYEINVDPDQANQDEMTVFINYQVRDYHGEFIGVSGVGLTVNRVNLLISSYEAKYDRHIIFSDSNGKVVLKPSNSIYDGISDLHEIKGLNAHVDDLISGKRTKITYTNEHRTHMLNCRYVPELKWFLLVEQNEEKLLWPFKKQLLINISIALLTTLIVAWISVKNIIRYNRDLEKQNIELTQTNRLIAAQKQEIQSAAEALQTSNRDLSLRNQEKDEFLGIFAHDLRNPLNGILGLCQITEPQDARQATFIEDIQNNSEQMMTLIDTLLEVSRVEGFHGTLSTESFEINDVVQSALNSADKWAKSKHIKLKSSLESTQGTQVESNPDWISICISNLLSNAVKYTPFYGDVMLSTTIKEGHVFIKVADTGPGISDEDQKKLYGKFTRLSAKPTAGESSTGLGLYIVKSIADRLGIKVHLRSAIGKGSTFELEIPTVKE